MAQIDLKNVTVRLCDGRRATLSPVSIPANSRLLFTDADYHRGSRWQTIDPITVAIIKAGSNTPLSVSVSGKDITINLATDGGGVNTSTAAQIITAYNLVGGAVALASISNAAGSSGAGLTDAAAKASLIDGPRNIAVKIGDGNLDWDETHSRTYMNDRGLLDAVKDGDQVPIDIKLAYAWQFLEAQSGVAQAVVSSGNAAPWVLSPSQTLVVHFDAGGDQTFTFTATRAIKAGTAPSLPPTASNTLLVKVDGGPQQTITFAGTESTATLVAALINSQLIDAHAFVNGSDIDIHSDSQGSGSSIQVTGGSAATAIGQAAGTATGTGNVVNIAAVTMGDALSVTAGITNGTATSDGAGHLKFTSNTIGGASSTQVKNTSTAAGFNFSNTAATGTGTPTEEDVFEQRGEAANWVSSSPDACEPYCIDIELENDYCSNGAKKEFIMFPMLRAEKFAHDPKASSVTVSGKCNVIEPTVYEF